MSASREDARANPGGRTGVLARARGGIAQHPRGVAGLAVVLLIAGAALFPPVREAIDVEQIQRWLAEIRSSPAGWAGVVLAFWVTAAVGVPVTALIAGIAAAFGAAASIAISLLGVAGSASLGFGAGRLFFGGHATRKLDGRLGRIADRVLDRGVLSLALLRNVPIAPFAVVNLACGATRLRLVHFVAGTLLGMTPGIVLAGLFGQELADWFAEPSLAGAARIALVVLLMIGMATLADRALRAREAGPAETA